MAVVVTCACKRDPAMQLLEAPPALQACVPAGDQYASVLEVRFGADGRGTPTHGCFSTSHDATCIKDFVTKSSRGEPGEMKRMLIVRSVISRPGTSSHVVGSVTFGELGKRTFNVLGDPCAMRPL